MATATRQLQEHRAKQERAAAQHRGSPQGLQHTDFHAEYAKPEANYDLFRQLFRITAHVDGQKYHLGGLVEQLTWTDSGDPVIVVSNQQQPLTGTMQMRKPALRQYKTLLPKFAEATMDRGKARYGATGAIVICDVGFGKTFHPVWAMRVSPGVSQTAAESVSLADGSWTLQLVDDLQLLAESMDDFKFTTGKKLKRKGWRADEITAAVCRQMHAPVKQLVRGTTRFTLPAATTQAATPLAVISAAWQEETNRTGRNFVIRWSIPDKRHPTGALEVVPLRRNKSLMRFRDQIIDATLTRSQQPDYATVILARAKLQAANGRTRSITYLARNNAAIRRYGWIHKILDFKPVQSHLELEIMAKRALAMRLTPLRTADLTHPGVATIRRGDAVRINIPEEGYAPVSNQVYVIPKTQGRGVSKYTAQAILAGIAQDPSLFGTPDGSTLSPISANTSTDPTKIVTTDTPVVLPVADQGIAFVSSVTHTVAAGSYDMSMTMQFVDTLDPLTVKAQMEANIRAAKAAARAASQSATPPAVVSGGGGSGVGTKWSVPVGWENDSRLGGACSGGSCRYTGTVPGDGMCFSILSVSGMSGDTGTVGQALTPGTQWPAGAKLYVTNPANNKTVLLIPCDIGAGSGSFHPVINLYGTSGTGSMGALGLSGGPPWNLVVQAAPGAPSLQPARGRAV